MWVPDANGHPAMENQNVANDGAHVDQQIGVNYGDSAFHWYESVYNINQGASPDELHRAAINHLDGGNPRYAEDILRSLLRDGHATTERVYQYVLAVLSDRSLDELDGALAASIMRAYSKSDVESDEWHVALEVVRGLLRCMGQQIDGRADQGLVDLTLREFASLPPKRQAEITRHLDRVLGGLVRNRLAEASTRWVVGERMEPRRLDRAWKFFQPDPAPPRRDAVPVAQADQSQLGQVALSGLGVVIGLALLLTGGSNPPLAVLGLLLLGVGGFLSVQNSIARAALALELARVDREHTPVSTQPPPQSPGHWVSTSFVEDLYSIVDRRFQEARPHTEGAWQLETSGIKATLKLRLLRLYGNAQVPAPAISWLARWHAERTAERWRTGRIFEYRAGYEAPARMTNLHLLGLVIAAVGLVTMLAAGAIAAAVLLGLSGYYLGKNMSDGLARRRAVNLAQLAADRLHAEEIQAYERWVALLADRPTDAEMARWLAMDKAFLKATALERFRLADNDLVDHIVMTEGAPHAMRARVPHGPPRYSTYVVYIFLLTKSGVRQVTVDLDFLQCRASNERRNSFRYEALASASVDEKGVRSANERASDQPSANGGGNLENVRLRSRSFRLTLVSGENIAVLMESFHKLTDARLENEAELTQLALQTSGVESALHVLEAVAAEGPDWIVKANDRRRHWSREWDAAETDLFALMNDPFRKNGGS